MQKRGVTKAVQTGRKVLDADLIDTRADVCVCVCEKRLTDCDDVAENAKGTKIVIASREAPATAQQRDNDRHDIRDGEEDHTGSAETVKGSGGSKVNAAQCDLADHQQHHGVQRYVELGMNFFPPLRARDGTVSGERVRATGRGRGASRSAQDAQHDDRNGECKRTALISDCRCENDGEWLSDGDKDGDVWENEAQRDEVDEATDHVEDDGADHGFGHLS